ncbi:MAG: isoprenylcysteine carboxylmethyltransferase family protein [Ignavibacteria bacterium]|nr:isoprenylcysteine carboxylmethyltransferase family protein [Ignavibacteria bacterium]
MIIRPGSFKSAVYVIIQFAVIFLIIISGKSLPENVFISGFFILFSSLGIWALIIIKFNFNIAPDPVKNITLVKTGPYKFIRHPMYTSVLGITACMVYSDFSLIRLTLWLILFIDLSLKLNYEEKLLLDRIPDYIAYAETTKKIIPFIF